MRGAEDRGGAAGQGERRSGQPVRVVMFVGLESVYRKLKLPNVELLEAIQESDVDSALQTIGTRRPSVVVVDASLNEGEPVEFAAMCHSCYPNFRNPIITVDPRRPTREVAIHDWSPQHNSFFERNVPLRFLKGEVLSALNLVASPGDDEMEQFRNLGRNESVKRGDRLYNIQTEVRVGETMAVTTMVFEGGSVLDNSVRHCRRSERELIKKINRVVGMQHYEAVAKVRQGRFD